METLRRALAGRLAAGAGLRRRCYAAICRRADGQGGAARAATGPGTPRCVEARDTIAFAYLVTVLLFARSGLYAERAQRPGLPRIVSALFQVDGRRADLRRRQRRAVLELLHLLRHARLRDRHPSARRAELYERATGVLLRAAGYRRRAVLVGSGKHIEDVAHALDGRGARAGRDGRLHLAHAAAGQRPALARADRGPGRGARRAPRPGGHHRRPGLPGGARGRARRPVPPARRDRADRAVDDGDPRPPRGVRARARRCRCSSCARRSSTASTTSSSARSTSSSRSCSCCCSARCCWRCAIARAASPRAGRCSTARSGPGIGGEPFACFKFRTMRSDADQLPGRPRVRSTRPPGALFKIRDDPRMTPRRRASCAATRSTSCRSCSTCSRGQMSLVGPRPLPQRDFDQLEDWHKKRYLVLPGRHRPVAGLRPLGAGLRRPRAARLPLPRALVGRARPHDPAQDHPGRALAPRRLLSGYRAGRGGGAARARRARRRRVRVRGLGRRATARGRRRRPPRPARTRRIARRFRAAGLDVRVQRFSTPRGRSRNVIGVRARPARLPARADGPRRLMPAGAGRRGQRVRARACWPRWRRGCGRPACTVWLVATGAEERHLHRLAGPPRAPARWRGSCRAARLRYALSLDEVGTRHAAAPALAGRRAAARRRARAAARRRPAGGASTGSATAAPATPTTASSSSPGMPRRQARRARQPVPSHGVRHAGPAAQGRVPAPSCGSWSASWSVIKERSSVWMRSWTLRRIATRTLENPSTNSLRTRAAPGSVQQPLRSAGTF